MIYCPKCGTANREGSKFCNECGEKLGTQTQLKCPECGALNSVQNVFCIECGARLLSSPAPIPGAEAAPKIKGLSLPTKPSQGEEEEELAQATPPGKAEGSPAWAQEVDATLPSKPAETVPVSPEERSPGGAESAEEIPAWLSDLRASLSEKPGGDALDTQTPYEEEASQRSSGTRPFASVGRPEPQPPAPEFEEGEIPDWLAELRPPAAPPEPKPAPLPPEAEEPEEQIPDWLAELQPSAAPPEPKPAALAPEAEQPEEQTPDWLAELRPPAAPPEPKSALPAPEAEQPEEQIPDWLAELRVSGAPAEPKPTVQVPEGEEPEAELPDWLADLRPPAAPAEPKPTALIPEAEEPEAELPDWLAELRPPAAPAGPKPTPPSAAVEEPGRQLPDWLAEVQSSEAPPGSKAEEPGEELPDWLAEQQPQSDREGSSQAPAMPQWLKEPAPAASERTPRSDETQAETEIPDWLVPAASGSEPGELLEKAEIPAWLLALKPRQLTEEVAEETAGSQPAAARAIEETGLLAGLQGTLPVEMLIAQPRAATQEPETVQMVDTPQARLFAAIVAKPPSVAPQPIGRRRTPLLTRLSQLIISLALLVAITLPLLMEKSPLARGPQTNPAVTALHDEIASLEGNAPVLVAFDYDPTTSGEMDVVAQAIIGHLRDQGARVVAISLLPAGPGTAQRLLEEVAGPGQFANLGYLPGQAVAVRDLGMSFRVAVPRDFQGVPVSDLKVMSGIAALQDFDLIVELAATQDSLRWWIEQARAPYGVAMGAGVSASLDPLARPYYETEQRQLVGLVAGVPGAAMYQTLQGAQEPLASRLDAQLAGHAVLVLVLLVGNGVYFVRRGTRREEER